MVISVQETFHLHLHHTVKDRTLSLVSLTEKNIIWYPQILDREDVILSYGDFPNMPLIRSRGCINYNPILAMRQLGYPMAYKPEDHLLRDMIIHDVNSGGSTFLRIIRAWGQVNCQRSNLKRPRVETIKTFDQWIKERVQKDCYPLLSVELFH